MARVKKVFRNSAEVAHIWAQQNGVNTEGRCSNVFFRDSMIWSYGHHFCMARILPNGTVVMTTRTYSPTTAGHLSDVRSAANHRKFVHCWMPDKGAAFNKEQAEHSIRHALEAADTERKVRDFTRWADRGRAIHHMDQFNEYLAALPVDERGDVKPITMVGIDELRRLVNKSAREHQTDLHARRAVTDERNRIKREERRRLDMLALAEKIPLWRAGQGVHLPFGAPTMLRLNGNRIQTSRSAEIPVRAAKALWPIILDTKQQGRDHVMSMVLGSFSLSKIRADGSIVVGCHDIPYAEIERMAVELGLIQDGKYPPALFKKVPSESV